MSRTWLFLHDDVVLTEKQEAAVADVVQKRLSGLPVAYITGVKEFYGRTFFVTQDVLIPKPDTELLVEKAVAYAKAALSEACNSREGADFEAERSHLGAGTESKRQFRFADICTGSGCIAVSVLAELFAEFGENCGARGKTDVARFEAGGAIDVAADFGRVHADATDISAAALAVARKNAETLLGGAALRSLKFYEGDLCSPLMAGGASDVGTSCGGDCADRGGATSGESNSGQIPKYDMVLSNPPYVPASVTDELLRDGRGEPRLALDGDTDSALADFALGGESARGGTVRAACGVRCDSPDVETSCEKSSDGLAIIRRLIPQVKKILLPGGVFFMETGEYNAEKAAEYLSKCGFTDIVIHRDLAGQLRLVESHI